jgi:hypothetical protein
MNLPPTTLTNLLELLEDHAKSIQKDAKEAIAAYDPRDRATRTIAMRYHEVAREMAHVAKLLRQGIDIVGRDIFMGVAPKVMRMKDGKVFVELDWVIETFRLLVDLSPVKAELALLDDTERGP